MQIKLIASTSKRDLQNVDPKNKFGLGLPAPFQPPQRSDRTGRLANYFVSGLGLEGEQR